MDQQHRPTGPRHRRRRAVLLVLTVLALSIWNPAPAEAASVARVPLATVASFSVLGGSAVTNTNATVLHRSLGVWPGTSITGFPPGRLVAPATMHVTDAVAQQAQADATAAYVNAENRPVSANTPADLGNLILPGGVYAGPSNGALQLTGPLTLDGEGDPTTVFIFKTSSSLTTASSSSIRLINGAQECNVFWQVGSSATLGSGSTFVGTIVALASVTLNSAVTVRGRAIARTGAVTMDGDVFTSPTCATTLPSTTTTTGAGATTTTIAGATTTTTRAPTTTTTVADTGGTGGGTGGTGGTTTPTTGPRGVVLAPDGLGGVVLAPGAGVGGVGSGTPGVVIPGTGTGTRITGGTTAGTGSRGSATTPGATSQRPATTGAGTPRAIPRTGVQSIQLVLLGLATVDIGVGALGLRLAMRGRRRS